MDNTSDAATHAEETEAQIGPAPLAVARENSVLAIVVMLLVSVAVLAAADWGLRDVRPVFREWGGTGDPLSGSAWTFPEDGKTVGPEGVSFEFNASQPGPVLSDTFDAAEVDHILADVTVERLSDGAAVPFQLECYWADPEQVAEGGAWPFSQERGGAFYRPVRHHPNAHQADVWRHAKWKGTVAKAVIVIRLWSNDPGPFRATFRRVALVE